MSGFMPTDPTNSPSCWPSTIVGPTYRGETGIVGGLDLVVPETSTVLGFGAPVSIGALLSPAPCCHMGPARDVLPSGPAGEIDPPVINAERHAVTEVVGNVRSEVGGGTGRRCTAASASWSG